MASTAKPKLSEIRENYSKLVEKSKSQKDTIEKLLENQSILQKAIKERDKAIESRDALIEKQSGVISTHEKRISELENQSALSAIKSVLFDDSPKQNQPNPPSQSEPNPIQQPEKSAQSTQTDEKLKEESNCLASSNEKLVGELEKEKCAMESISKENEKLKTELSAAQIQLSETKDNYQKELERQKKEYDERIATIQIDCEQLSKKNESFIAEKAEIIEKLSTSEAKKSETEIQLSSLRAENLHIRSQLSEINSAISLKGEEIAQLRKLKEGLERDCADKEKEDLVRRKANSELQHAYESIRSQLEDTNEKMGQMKEEYEKTKSGLDSENSELKAKVERVQKKKKVAEASNHAFEVRVQSLEDDVERLKQRNTALEKDMVKVGDTSAIFPGYIRKIMLQFFMQDGATRDSLVPVILGLLQCDSDVIQQARRRWAESNQIISHAFSFIKW